MGREEYYHSRLNSHFVKKLFLDERVGGGVYSFLIKKNTKFKNEIKYDSSSNKCP